MMKRLFCFGILFACLLSYAYTPQCPMPCTSLTGGEVLEYEAYFQLGALRIDRLYLQTQAFCETFEGDSVYTILATGETQKTMLRFFGLHDSFYVHLRSADLLPLYYYEHDIERKYHGQKEYHYQYTDSALRLKAYEFRNGDIIDDTFTFDRSCPLDALSLVFRLRNFPFEEALENELFSFDFFNKGKRETLTIRYIGRETLFRPDKTSIDCHKLVFDVSEGSLFSREHPVTIYLTTDRSHKIVHAEAKLKVGYAKVDLLSSTMQAKPQAAIFKQR